MPKAAPVSDLVAGSYISVAPVVLNVPAAPPAPAVLLSKFQFTSVDEAAWSELVASAATARISMRLVVFMVVESRAKDDLQEDLRYKTDWFIGYKNTCNR